MQLRECWVSDEMANLSPLSRQRQICQGCLRAEVQPEQKGQLNLALSPSLAQTRLIFHNMSAADISDSQREFFAEIGAKGGKVRSSKQQAQLASIRSKGRHTVTEKKLTHLASISSKGGQTVTPKKLAHLSSIHSKGGQTVTPKKLAHLASIQSKGGQTMTPKRLEHLAKARAARLAKLQQKKAANG